MKIFLLFASCMLFCGVGKAQILHTIYSAGYNGTVASSRQFADLPSFVLNPASLAAVKDASAAAYTEKRYSLKELTSGSVILALPVQGGGIGIAAGLSGSAAFNESAFGVAYGKKLGQAVSLGAQISYNLVHMEGYGNAAAIGFELGTTVQLSDKMYTGFYVCNPAGGRFGHNSGEKLAAIYTVVFGYEFSGKLLLNLQTEKTVNQPVDIAVSLHYAFAKQFFIRTGTATTSGNMFAGFGLSWKNIRMDMIGYYHLQLGITPGLQFIVHFQKEEE